MEASRNRGPSLPIACTLDGLETGRRWREWEKMLDSRLDFQNSGQQLTVTFPGDGDLRTRLTDLVEAERLCCAFVSWDLDQDANHFELRVSGSSDGVAAIAESFGLGS